MLLNNHSPHPFTLLKFIGTVTESGGRWSERQEAGLLQFSRAGMEEELLSRLTLKTPHYGCMPSIPPKEPLEFKEESQ